MPLLMYIKYFFYLIVSARDLCGTDTNWRSNVAVRVRINGEALTFRSSGRLPARESGRRICSLGESCRFANWRNGNGSIADQYGD
jgi:hypothetical protein